MQNPTTLPTKGGCGGPLCGPKATNNYMKIRLTYRYCQNDQNRYNLPIQLRHYGPDNDKKKIEPSSIKFSTYLFYWLKNYL